MATRRPTILPMRDRPEPRPRPYDLLPLADPAGAGLSRGEVLLMSFLTIAFTLLMIGIAG